MGGGILGSRQKRKGSACAGPFWFFIPVATDSADRCERRGGSELGFAAASWRWPPTGRFAGQRMRATSGRLGIG